MAKYILSVLKDLPERNEYLDPIEIESDDPRGATEALQRTVENLRRDGIASHIEARVYAALDNGRAGEETGHFVYKAGSTQRLRVKPTVDRSDVPERPKAREEGLSDLLRVGSEKPLGYLGMETIKMYEAPEELQRELESRGLHVMYVHSFSHDEVPDFMYVYDERALQKLLDENKRILEEARWPLNAKEFAERVANESSAAAYTELFTLIATAFGDFKNSGRIENVLGPDVENEPPKPQWEKPSLEEEMGELKRHAEDSGINLELLVRAFENAELEVLSDEDWVNMENCDSSDAKWTLDQVRTHLNGKRDFARIEQGIMNGDTMPAPVVLYQKGQRPNLLAGSSRLLGCRVFGLRPIVLALRLEG